MKGHHHYKATIQWTGNKGTGTDHFTNYERSHVIKITNKPDIAGSSDAPFRGDISKHNPEDLLLSSLSTCHMLWFLHLCADAGIIVIDYVDHATGLLVENPEGGGRFTEVILHPIVTVTESSMIEKANELHHKAHEKCFIANSVNFPVKQLPTAKVDGV